MGNFFQTCYKFCCFFFVLSLHNKSFLYDLSACCYQIPWKYRTKDIPDMKFVQRLDTSCLNSPFHGGKVSDKDYLSKCSGCGFTSSLKINADPPQPLAERWMAIWYGTNFQCGWVFSLTENSWRHIRQSLPRLPFMEMELPVVPETMAWPSTALCSPSLTAMTQLFLPELYSATFVLLRSKWTKWQKISLLTLSYTGRKYEGQLITLLHF